MQSAEEKRLELTHVLGVGFLKQRDPELVGLRDVVGVHQSVVDGWQAVINQHLHPATKVPELEPKYSCSHTVNQRARQTALDRGSRSD